MLKSLLTAAAASVLFATAALAGDITLQISDYDIDSVEGIDTLHKDIIVASEDVCDSYKADPMLGVRGFKKCIVSTVDQTVYGSEVEPLIAFHEALPAEDRYDADRPTPTVELREVAALSR